MHSLVAIALAPLVLAAKSKTPFYIAGGVLVAWALIVSLVLGLRKARFPYDLRGQRTVSAITAVLVLAAMVTAVTTAGGEGNAETAAAKGTSVTGAAVQGQTSATPTPAAPTAPAKTGTAPTKKATPAPAAPPATKLSLEANSSGLLQYNTKQLATKAGTVTIVLSNSSPVEHNVTIAAGGTTVGSTPTFTGGSKSVTLQLKAGTYTFFCSVPGHRAAGMEGTLTVQ
jgi:plastocyanin